MIPFSVVFRKFGGIFEFDQKSVRLLEINQALEDPAIWNEQEKVQLLGRERAQLEHVLRNLENFEKKLEDANALFELAEEASDADLFRSL